MAKKAIRALLDDALDGSIRQISGQDAAFLYAESSLNPMLIGTLIIVEDSLEFKDFKAILASKLHLMPKFRQRLLNVPFNLDYPYWVDDPHFNLDLHINRIKLPDPANWKTLREITATIFSASLDLRRPLWSMTFIEGLDEISQIPKGSVAILAKVHHTMIDGASGVGIMGLLFDRKETDKNLPIPEPQPFEPETLPEEISLLLKSASKFIKDPLKVPKVAAEAAGTIMQKRAKKMVGGKNVFNKKSFSVPKTIFNNSISPKRTWGTAILFFDRINALRKIMGVTVNDVIINICAGAIRKYLIEKEKLPSQSLVANVPISIRVKGEKQNFDNKISNMLVQIGTQIEDPIQRLEFIREPTELGKLRHKAVGARSLMQMAESVPFGLANLASGLYSKYNIKELHRPPFNVTITNVPGPQSALYLKGHKTVGFFGLTPVVDGFGLIIAAFSYNGLVSIPTTSDDNTMPDVIGRFDASAGSLSYSAALMLRQIAYNDGTDDESEMGYAVSFSGKYAMGNGDDLKFMLSSGALGRYIALNAFRDGGIEADGSIDLNNVTGGFVAYKHMWSPQMRSTVSYAFADADNSDAITSDITKSINNMYVNLMYSPTKKLTFGGEYILAERETESGLSGDLSRIQFTSKLSF